MTSVFSLYLAEYRYTLIHPILQLHTRMLKRHTHTHTWHSKIMSNSSSLDKHSASPSSQWSWSCTPTDGLATEGISQRWSSILAPCNLHSVSNRSSSSQQPAFVRWWWLSSWVLTVESGKEVLWSSRRRLWLLEIISRNPSSICRSSWKIEGREGGVVTVCKVFKPQSQLS